MVAQRTNLSSQIVIYGILIILGLLWTIPTFGLLVTSFRVPDDTASSGWWEVFTKGQFNFTLQNYTAVLSPGDGATSNTAATINLNQAIVNTIIMAVPSTVIPIFLAALAAYAFAWMNFPGRKFLFMVLVALLVVPLQMSLIPILRDYRVLGLNGTFLGVWLANTGFGLPLATYLLYNYIVTLPREVFESAVVDGASHPIIFSKLVVPLSMPAFASFAIFQFLWVWNGVLIPLVFLLMSLLCILFFSRRDSVLSRGWVGFAAVVTVLLSIMAGFGLLFLIGVPFT